MPQLIIDAICRKLGSLQSYEDASTLLPALKKRSPIVGMAYSRYVRETAKASVMDMVNAGNFDDSSRLLSLIESMFEDDCQDDFDAYMQFMEWDRPADKRFWQPRREKLWVVCEDLQDLHDGLIDFYALSVAPGIGKSTIGCFFMSFEIGNNPESSSVMSGYADNLTSSFYSEMLDIVGDDVTYRFSRVFPESNLVDKNSQKNQIHLKKWSRFPTLTCRPIGGSLTGAVRIQPGGILYCDDMVKDYEEALNAERMDKLYSQYLSQLYDRRMNNTKEFHIGTRWVPNDVIGRRQDEYSAKNDGRSRFRTIPALDGVPTKGHPYGQSNFDYPFNVGFSTEYFEDQRSKLINAGLEDNWSAKYMCEPFWKEGRLYEHDDLRFYEALPSGEPDIVLAVCDTKTKGPDYCVQVVDYVYGDDHYIHAVTCDDGLMESIQPRLVDQLCIHKVSIARYESNVAGGKIAADVEGSCRMNGHPIVMKTKYSTENKETRILADSGWVKQRCLFRCDSRRGSEYDRFMTQLLSYNAKSKNKHDDVPDAMSMLRRFVDASIKPKVKPMKRPW